MSKDALSYQLAKYGLTKESYAELLESQGGVCAICWRTEDSGKRLAIDHNHDCCSPGGSCGRCIRGLLCSRCNANLLGHYSIPQLERAINYITRGEQNLRNLNKDTQSLHVPHEWWDRGYVELNW